MSCKQCGHTLSHLTAVLAQTEIGTQCPKCWAKLRSVHVNHAFRGKRRTDSSSAIAYDLCNLRRLPGRYRNINRSSLASFQKRLVRIAVIQGEVVLAIVGGEDLSRRLFGSMSQDNSDAAV